MKIKTLFLAILLVRTLCSTAQVVNNQAAPQKVYTLADSTSKKLENILNELEADIDAKEKGNPISAPQTFTFPNGDTYVGQRKDGKANGQGTITFSSGNYVGEWKDDKKNGQGTMTIKFGEEYFRTMER